MMEVGIQGIIGGASTTFGVKSAWVRIAAQPLACWACFLTSLGLCLVGCEMGTNFILSGEILRTSKNVSQICVGPPEQFGAAEVRSGRGSERAEEGSRQRMEGRWDAVSCGLQLHSAQRQ